MNTRADIAHPTKSSARRVLLAALYLAVLGTFSLSLLGSAGAWWWLLDLFSHFRVQYSIALFVMLPLLAWRREWIWVLVALAALLWNLALIVPLFLGSPTATDKATGQLTVVMYNMHHRNQRVTEIATWLSEQDADLVIVLEANTLVQASLAAAMPDYQMIGETREDAFGMLLLSRQPLLGHESLFLSDARLPALSVTLRQDLHTYSVLAVHTMPPVGSDNSALRDRMLKEAGIWAQEQELPIIIGDLNATPWSHAFRSVLETANLKNSQIGFGLQTSWPRFWPLSIPIDHALVDSKIVTIDRSLGPSMGSDHEPLLIRVGVLKTLL